MAKKSKKDKEIEKKWKGKTEFKIGFKSLKGLRGALRQKLSNMRKEAEYPEFSLKRPSHLVVLPTLKKMAGLDIKYPLLEPLAHANIKWVPEKKRLVYFIHEPELTPEEKELLEKIKSDLRELIDVEISVIEKRKEAIDYLEGKLKTVLAETGINLPKETYIKIIYYIIRDFVGLNEIEPLMNDPYIEDVGCDGLGVPIYIVHRKFGSVETGIIYRDIDYLNNFVIKLAERCGRYVSYAKPLMDGTLPDGSRVQVSIAKDVTTKGPTFSIRKFKTSPFSPIELIDLKTASPELMAYLWLAVQHSTSLLICGGVATGKTTFLNCITMFIPPEDKIVSIEDTRELNLPHQNWIPSVARVGFGVPEASGRRYGEVSLFELLKESFRQNPDYVIVGEVRGKEAYVMFQGMASIPGKEKVLVLNNNQLKRICIEDVKPKEGFKIPTIDIEKGNIKLLPIARKLKHRPTNELYKITTKKGREILVTPHHSLFTYNGNCSPVPVSALRVNDNIVIPGRLPCGYNDIKRINLMETLPDIRVFAPFYIKEAVKQLGFDRASKFIGVKSISDFYSNFKRSKCSALRADKFIKLMEKTGIAYNPDKLLVRYDNKSKSFPAKLEITPELLRLMGYIISEGSLSKTYGNNRISLYSQNKDIKNDMLHCIKTVTGITPKERITKGFGWSIELSFNHKVLFEFLKRNCGTGKTDRKIPDFIFGLSKERIGHFLSSLYTGDGSLSENCFGYYTISRNLANDLSYLLLTLGIVARINKRKRKGRKTTDYEILFYTKDEMETLLKYINYIGKIPKLTRKGKINIKKKGDMYIDKVISKEKVILRKPVPVYDFSVNGTQNFIGGFGGVLLHNSGHPCVGTIHAGSVDDVIKRLETPPIELSTSLVETLDLIIVMVHAKEKGKSSRRVKEVVEMISVDSKTGRAHTLRSFVWVPSNDSHESNVMESRLLRKISFQKGIPYAKIMEELKNRKNVLEWMLNYGVTDFEDICKLINLYYKEPSTIMKWVNNNTPPYKAKYKGKIKKLWESATGLKIIKEEAGS